MFTLTMVKNKLFGMFFIFILLASSVVALSNEKIIATVEPTREYLEVDMSDLSIDEKDSIYKLSYKIKNDTDKLKFKEMSIYADKKDFKVENDKGSSIFFKRVSNSDILQDITIHKKEGFATEIAGAFNVSLDYATIVLAKTNVSYISYISHSEDGINFTRSNIKFYQNYTHVWFNTTHFSSFTGSIGDLELLGGGDTVYIDISDFATIDATDYVCLQYGDSGSFSEICNDAGATTGQASNTLGQDTYFIDLDSVGDFALDPDNNLFVDNSFNVLIRDSGGGLDTFQSLTVTVRAIVPPDPDINTPTLVTETTARLNGDVDFNDWTSTVSAFFSYREYGTSSWTDTSSQSVTDGVDFYADITGLDVGTQYQSILNIGWGSSTDTDGIMYFTTASTVEPSVTTLTATGIGITTATLRGYPLKGGFTGTVTGRFAYRELPSGTWSYTSGQTITNDVSYSSVLTGLTEDQAYEYYATLSWTDGTTKNADGTDISFTPTAPSSGGTSALAIDNLLYYKMEDASSPILDSTANSIDATCTACPVFETIGKIDNAMDFEAADELLFSNANLAFGTADFSVCFWAKSDQNSEIRYFLGTTDSQFAFYYHGASLSEVVFTIQGSGDGILGSTNADAITDTNWHFFCGVRTGLTTTEVWIDGVDETYAPYSDFVGSASITTNTYSIGNANAHATRMWDGKIDEISFFDVALTQTQIEELYASGSPTEAQQYPFGGSETLPTATTLSPIDINETGVTLRGSVDIGTFNGSVFGFFEYRNKSGTSWTLLNGSVTPIANDTIYSLILNNLTSNQDYEYHALTNWYDETSLLAYGDNISFNTSKIIPAISQFGSSNTTETSTDISWNLSLNDYDWSNFILSYATYPDILGGSPTFTDIYSGNKTVDGVYKENIANLTTGTKYGYILYFNYGDAIGNTALQTFTVGASTIPTVGSIITDRITRTTARSTIDVNSMGLYSLANITFYIRETGAGTFDTLKSFIITTPQNLTYEHSGLTVNTAHDLIIQIDYGVSVYNTSLYYFETYSNTDFVPPFLDAYTPVVTVDSAVLLAEVNLQNVTTSNLVYEVLGDLNSTYINGFTSSGLIVTVDGNYTFNLTGLDTNELFYRAKLTYNNGTDDLILTTDYYSFTPLREGDVTIASGTFELLPNWYVEIRDPYLFSLILLIGITVIGLSFGIALGQSQGVMRDNAPKFLIYIVLGLLIIITIFLRLNGLIPIWQLVINMTGVTIMSLFYMLNGGVHSYG